jgi:hypothetical protein
MGQTKTDEGLKKNNNNSVNTEIVPKGIKPMHYLCDLELSDEVRNFFMNLKNE